MIAEFKPLNAAWSAVNVHGSQAGIELADMGLDAAGGLMKAATAGNAERSPFLRWLRGVEWTAEKSATYDEVLRRLMRLRADLVHLARSEAKHEEVVMAIDRAEQGEH